MFRNSGFAVEEGIRSPNISQIVLGGEKVPAGTKRKLRSLCRELGSGHVDIISTYALTESKMAWPECPVDDDEKSSGYHLYPDFGIIEIVDPDSGDPVGEGEPGEIVFTPLDSRGSVVLRYRTGDCISGGLTYETCPHCGRTLPRLLGRISRISDVKRMNISKLKGTMVNFNDLEYILDDLDNIGTWQIELRKRNDDPLDSDEIVIHVAPRKGISTENLTKEIESHFVTATEIKPNRVEYHDDQTLRDKQCVGSALKEVKVIDLRSEAT